MAQQTQVMSSPHQKIPRLPPEIVDTIIDHLHDYPSSLLNCALVSKLFFPRARSNFFGSVSIVTKRSAGDDESLLAALGNAFAWEGFVDLLNSAVQTNPLGFVRRLQLAPIPCVDREYPITSQWIHRILQHIPHLSALFLHTTICQIGPHEQSVPMAGPKPKLDHLTFYNISTSDSPPTLSFHSFKAIYDILCLFSHIGSLNIENVYYIERHRDIPLDDFDLLVTPQVTAMIKNTFPTISTLKFNDISKPGSLFFYAVVRLSSANILRSLCVSYYEDYEPAILARLLREATVLTDLYLETGRCFCYIPYLTPSPESWRKFGLSKSKSLKKLFLPVHLLPVCVRETFTSFLDLISSITDDHSCPSTILVLGLPFDISRLVLDNDESVTGSELEHNCIRILVQELDWSRLSYEVTKLPNLEELAIGIMTEDGFGRREYISKNLKDQVQRVFEQKLVPLMPARIRVNIREFDEEQF